MATVRSTRFWSYDATHSSLFTLYTVPAGQVAVVKSIAVRLANSSTGRFVLGLLPSGSSDLVYFYDAGSPGIANAVIAWSGLIIGEPGDAYQLAQIGGSAVQAISCGFGSALTP